MFGPASDSQRSLILAGTDASTGLALLDGDGVVVESNAAFRNLCSRQADEAPAGWSLSEQIGHDVTAADKPIKLPATRVSLFITELTPGGYSVMAERNGARGATASFLPSEIDAARRDPLTGLGNRRLLNETLEDLDAAGAQSLALLMIDLDRFKQVNDTLGHAAGDKLLELAAERIRSATRSEDGVIRVGGDEFVVLQSAVAGASGPTAVATRIVEFMNRPFLIDGQQVNLGASVGIAMLSERAKNTSDLMRHADLALYAAKSSGRGTFRFFENQLEEDAIERRELELRLRKALSQSEFALVYQPKVTMPEGAVCGFEALIRWNDPEQGLVPPNDFIPLAEELGEIHGIGEWVLRESCKEALSWPSDIVVGVNVSPIQFENDKFVSVVRQVLDETGLEPGRLELEITEGVLMKDTAAALQRLWAIKELGVRIAMDDFGTGYSSLSYLNSFPFSAIKIDQSFVRGEDTDRSRKLVSSILALGSSLGMKTIAEGVETSAQYEHLADEGCMEAQGFLISQPMAPGEVGTFLDNYSRTNEIEVARELSAKVTGEAPNSEHR